jgi:hypothetical protein
MLHRFIFVNLSEGPPETKREIANGRGSGERGQIATDGCGTSPNAQLSMISVTSAGTADVYRKISGSACDQVRSVGVYGVVSQRALCSPYTSPCLS